nr:cysteine-rich receptor-like protein kinase 4 [Quercus suber]
MPNKSLDFFLFDSTKKSLLNWKKRFNIIEGIAQGILIFGLKGVEENTNRIVGTYGYMSPEICMAVME